jgi:hypothetical protein
LPTSEKWLYKATAATVTTAAKGATAEAQAAADEICSLSGDKSSIFRQLIGLYRQ